MPGSSTTVAANIAKPAAPFQQQHFDNFQVEQITTPGIQTSSDNNLQILSTAAMAGSYVSPQSSSTYTNHAMDHTTLLQNGAPMFDAADAQFLAHSFENDLADFIQGYAPLGWQGWGQ